MIAPTVGRQVWYHPGEGDYQMAVASGQPMAATVVAVWSDTCVSLQVLDCNGIAWQRTSVHLCQGDSYGNPGGGPWCEWMPYQKAQAESQKRISDIGSPERTADLEESRPDLYPK